ncbi:MAG: 2-amino-4-hydroxy-6-hydroxymethyldihydropteridine diphosphokinase [Gammaproteobacteria bacterium]
MIDTYIGLGSNLHEPKNQVLKAFQRIAVLDKVVPVAQSSLYKSAPMGPQDQAAYINAVISIKTSLRPLCLLGRLAKIEEDFGRDRTVGHWGPRVIDLDLLLYGDKEIRLRRLTVPHIGLTEREFVVFPLLEICPDLVLPSGRALSEIAKHVPVNSLEKL